MKTIHTSAAIAVCAMTGAFAFLPQTRAEITAPHTEAGAASSPAKAGMRFSPGDGQPGHFRLECHEVTAYDALVAIAKRRGYELSFDPAGEAACRSAALTGIYCQPWLGLADIEPIIIESISKDAGLPPGQILRFIRPNRKKGPARIAVVERSQLNASGQLEMVAARKSPPAKMTVVKKK